MNQHISSMLEHFSALRRKNSETPQVSSSNDKISSMQVDENQKDVSDVESMSSKTKNLFKDLISDNGATNTILQNCTNFIKCTSNLNASASTCAPANGTYKQQKVDNHDGASDSNRKQEVETIFNLSENNTTLHAQQAFNNGNANTKKRNSLAPNGDLNPVRELSPSPRSYRKASYDSRMLKTSTDEESGRHSSFSMKPLKTKNIVSKNETFDTLHYKAMDVSIDLNYRFKIMSLVRAFNFLSACSKSSFAYN